MTVKDFLENDYFVFYMLAKDSESIKYWESYLKRKPEDRQHFENAEKTFKKIQFETVSLQTSDRELLYDRIFEKPLKHTIAKRRRNRNFYLAAATIVVLIALGVYTSIKPSKIPEIIVEKSSTESTIQLITNNKIFSLSNNEVLTINQSTITNSKGENLQINDTPVFNTLKVPFGKRSELILADGSKLWVNSGSTVKFPSKFNDANRTIYLEGEIFIEVTKDKAKPFVVETSKFSVNVYGTTFDVKAYNNAPNQRVVLVEGAVGVKTQDDKEIRMRPNESLEITRSQLLKTNVNTEMYTSWKNGYLVFDDTPVETILLELSRYYNVTFLDTENKLTGKTCTGKIYLSSNIEDVLETLSILSNSTFKVKNNTI